MPMHNKPRRGKSGSITAPTSIQPHRSRQPCTHSVAMHPLRRDAPDQKGCNAYGSGAPPPTTSTTAGTPSRHTTTGRIRRSHTASKHSHRFHARGAAPVTSRYTRSVAMHPIRRGVMPTDRVHHLIDNKLHRGSGGQPHLLPEFYKPRSLSSALDTTAMH